MPRLSGLVFRRRPCGVGASASLLRLLEHFVRGEFLLRDLHEQRLGDRLRLLGREVRIADQLVARDGETVLKDVKGVFVLARLGRRLRLGSARSFFSNLSILTTGCFLVAFDLNSLGYRGFVYG